MKNPKIQQSIHSKLHSKVHGP